MTTRSNLTWTDLDGDRFTLSEHRSREGREPAIAVVQVVDGETDKDNEVYMDEEDARQVIAWLSAVLRER